MQSLIARCVRTEREAVRPNDRNKARGQPPSQKATELSPVALIDLLDGLLVLKHFFECLYVHRIFLSKRVPLVHQLPPCSRVLELLEDLVWKMAF